MILNDEQLAMIFDEKETGYVSMTKESLESLRETFADLKRQLKEWDAWVEEFIPCAKHGLSRCRECHSHVALDAYVQERVDRAVLVEIQWGHDEHWNVVWDRKHGLTPHKCEKTLDNIWCARLAANRQKVEKNM